MRWSHYRSALVLHSVGVVLVLQVCGVDGVAGLGLMLCMSSALAGIVVMGLWAAVEPADEQGAFLRACSLCPSPRSRLCSWMS